MNIKGFRNYIWRTSFYIPFTLYFLLFAVAAAICWQLLSRSDYPPETSFADIFLLLVKIAGWFSLVLLTVAFASVLVAWLFCLYFKKKSALNFKLSTDVKTGELHQKQTVRLFIRPVIKPLFGFLKIRLQYDTTHFSNKFLLLEQGRRGFLNTTIEGVYHWPLTEIKEYHIENAILYFEDFFQFFSIAVSLPANDKFYTQPTTKHVETPGVFPRKTEDTSTRIEELRKVEGEYLNYKNFENNDDVRRIVWKIYAKNKELVVRVPEVMDPYASHVYLYASFFSDFETTGDNVVNIPFLNFYKINIWNIYQHLVKQGYEVKYLADQDIARRTFGDEQQAVKYAVSTSRWHDQKDLRSYVNTKDAAIILITSLSDSNQVAELVEKYGGEIRFIFIKLSDSLRKQNAFDWVQWLFVKNQDHDVETYKRLWSLSTNRSKISDNEKRIETLLNTYAVV